MRCFGYDWVWSGGRWTIRGTPSSPSCHSKRNTGLTISEPHGCSAALDYLLCSSRRVNCHLELMHRAPLAGCKIAKGMQNANHNLIPLEICWRYSHRGCGRAAQQFNQCRRAIGQHELSPICIVHDKHAQSRAYPHEHATLKLPRRHALTNQRFDCANLAEPLPVWQQRDVVYCFGDLSMYKRRVRTLEEIHDDCVGILDVFEQMRYALPVRKLLASYQYGFWTLQDRGSFIEHQCSTPR